MKKRKKSPLLAMMMLGSALLYGCAGSNETEAPAASSNAESVVETTAKTDNETENSSVDYGSLELTMGSTGAADDISTQAMAYMKEYIEEKSGGAIVLNTFPSSQLGAAVDQLEMTGQGSVDLFLEANYMSNNGVNEAKVGGLTFTCTSKEDYQKINESELCEGWKDTFCELNNIKIIANNWYRNGTALVSNKEIHTVEDMKGVKVRVPQLDITMESFSEVGMNPTPIAYNESLLGLQQGIVEAIWCTEDAAYTMGFYEVAKYLIELNSFYDSMFVYMNNDLYNSVTDAQRDLIVEAALEAGKYYSGLADEILATNVAKMKEAGIEVISLPPEEVAKLQASMKVIADRNEAAGEWPVGTYAEVLELLGK